MPRPEGRSFFFTSELRASVRSRDAGAFVAVIVLGGHAREAVWVYTVSSGRVLAGNGPDAWGTRVGWVPRPDLTAACFGPFVAAFPNFYCEAPYPPCVPAPGSSAA